MGDAPPRRAFVDLFVRSGARGGVDKLVDLRNELGLRMVRGEISSFIEKFSFVPKMVKDVATAPGGRACRFIQTRATAVEKNCW